MNRKISIIFTRFFICIIIINCAQNLAAQTYGLKFQGQDVTLDKRTELNLTPDNFLKFKEEFEISFDYKLDFKAPNLLFGYVLRIVNDENINVDLISTPDTTQPLNLVIGKNNKIVPVFRFENIQHKWINLRLKFMLSENKMIFYKKDTFYVLEDVGFKKHDNFKIIFGANDYKQFKTTDVPSMNIRNVRLFENGKLEYFWPLDNKEGEIVNDKIKKAEATVENPIWLIREHDSWNKRFETEVDGILKFAADINGERVFLIGKNELIIYSIGENTTQTIAYKNTPDFFNETYHAFYNPADNKIYCYLIGSMPFYSFDFNTEAWSETGAASDAENRYRHHNSYFNPDENSLYIFGGYGFHKYNNEIFKADLNNNSWQSLETNDSIFRPRYLSGLGVLNDTVYILGGYGSESGNQLINPQSYSDLFGYSLKNGSLFKKFEIPRIIDDMTVASSMWIDNKTRNYYGLIFEKTRFNGSLQLIQGSLDSPEVVLLGNKIPYRFLDIKSSAGLIYLPKKEKLCAYTFYLTDSITTQAEIYDISYPPNMYETDESQTRKMGWLYWLAGFVLMVVLVFFHWKRRNKKTISEKEIEVSENSEPEFEHVDFSPGSELTKTKYQLIFFGGFQVFNKDFEDITSKFSPLLKELFLLIWLYTYKNNKGISSDKITEILWFDKSEKSSRNNRAVNIAKIRSILEEVGECVLSKKTGYWKINCEDTKIRCDYIDFLKLTSSKTNLTKQKIKQLINITEKGAFLHNVAYDWLDEFKSRTSDTIIDTFVEFGNSCDIKKEPEFIIHLADAIFNFDFINEDAMMMKCKAEYYMGKHSLAKSTYEKFCKEYFAMYDQEYENSFLKILNIKD